MTEQKEGPRPSIDLPAPPVIVLDGDGQIEMMNQAAIDLVQDPIDSLSNRRADNSVQARYLWLAGVLQFLGSAPEAIFQREVATKDGVKPFRVRLCRLISPEGKDRGTVVALESIDGQKRLLASSPSTRSNLSPYYLVDEFTGLQNRRGFSLLATHLLRLADQSQRHLAFLVCVLKGRKSGDARGREGNDQAVLAVADILRDTFRASDVIGRVGRGVFAVLAAGSFDGGAQELDNRLRAAIDASRLRSEFDGEISISVGLIPYDPMYPREVEELLARLPGSV